MQAGKLRKYISTESPVPLLSSQSAVHAQSVSIKLGQLIQDTTLRVS